MTGIDTAPMIESIMSGSLIRATPPCTRMSAGTRSSAITATAPASSAILACSGVTTSMITPPLSISAMPRFTRAVPVSGSCPGGEVCAGPRGVRGGRPPGPALRVDTRTSLDQSRLVMNIVWSARGGTERGAGLIGDEGVVHLEEHRVWGPAGQAQHARQRPAAGVPGHCDHVVVELAGQVHLVRGLLDLGQ